MLVALAERMTIFPPLPLSVASALTVAPAAIRVFAAVCVRSGIVPMETEPPPALPDALRTDVALRATLPEAVTAMVPPAVPDASPSAPSWPTISILPPTPAMAIVPVLLPTVVATILPPAETKFCTTPSAAAAVSVTVPPAAWITPVLVTNAVTPSGVWVTCLVIFNDTSLSPYISIVTACAPASTTLPNLALMVPELATDGATNAARPAPRTVSVPWLITLASGFAGWSNTILPAMKLPLEIPTAVTISPFVLTWAPL